MGLLKQFAERIDNDNGYDNLTMAKDLIKIAKKHYDSIEGKLPIDKVVESVCEEECDYEDLPNKTARCRKCGYISIF